MPADFVYLDDNYGDYIKIDGVCYERIGNDTAQPDFIGSPQGQGYTGCTDCATSVIETSSSSLSSSSSSINKSSSSLSSSSS
jgi:hypothetical protein